MGRFERDPDDLRDLGMEDLHLARTGSPFAPERWTPGMEAAAREQDDRVIRQKDRDECGGAL